MDFLISELRSMLAGAPSEESWESARELLTMFGEACDARLIDYCRGQLGRWPGSIRRLADRSWCELVLREPHRDPRMRLANEAYFDNLLLGNDGAEDLARSPSLGTLRRLSLDNTRLASAGIVALAGSLALPSLEELSVQLCGPGARGLEAMLQREGLPALRALDLSRCGIGRLELAHCSELDGVQLQTLNLAGNPLGDEGIEELLNARWAPQLRKLDLQQTGMGVYGAQLLGRSIMLEQLEDLALRVESQDATRPGVTHYSRGHDQNSRALDGELFEPFLEGNRLPALRRLDVHRMHLPAQSLEQLLEAPFAPSLEVLESSTSTLDREVAILLGNQQRLTNLRQLRFTGSFINHYSLNLLGKGEALEDVAIEHQRP